MSTSLAIEVTELAVARAQAVEHHVKTPRTFFTRLQASLQSFFAGHAEKVILSSAKYFADQAVWFEGARVRLANKTDGANALSEKSQRVLEELETKLLKSREEAMILLAEVERDRGAGSAKVAAAIRADLHARSDLYEAVVAYRWAAMELDADREMASGNVSNFESVDALLADLSK